MLCILIGNHDPVTMSGTGKYAGCESTFCRNCGKIISGTATPDVDAEIQRSMAEMIEAKGQRRVAVNRATPRLRGGYEAVRANR